MSGRSEAADGDGKGGGIRQRLSRERERLWELLRRASRSYVVLIVVGVVVGLQVAPVVSNVTPTPERDAVAVITLQGGIDGDNAASVVERLRAARESPGIEAVVLRVNSGGGGASASESVYMAVRRTADEMPVVVSIQGIAASGAYYASVPADVVYTKPASFVGSVGVIFLAPAGVPPLDRLVITGPDKLTGADLRQWQYKIESVKRAFVGAVEKQRGEELELSRAELSNARLYSGIEGVDNGLVDRVGSTEDAIETAARMAGISNYGVRVMGYDGTVSYVTQSAYTAAPTDDKELVPPATFVRDPRTLSAPNPVMLPASVVRTGVGQELGRVPTNATEVGVNATA